MARRIKLTVAYDGTGYCGWQLQKNGVTVEQRLNEAISSLTGETIQVVGASRTDSGVHAMGNVAVFDTDTRIPAEKLAYALNARLPEDIRVTKSEEALPGFHPRKANSIKTYVYRIWNHPFENPMKRLYAAFIYFPLDVERMREAAAWLIGEHDFKSFASAGGQAEETIRTIYRLDVERQENEILITVSGSGFLYNMVRIIAGTLIQAGAGAFPADHVREILSARDRQAAGQTAPARGLTLAGIEYEKALADWLPVREAEWRYGIWQKEILSAGEAYLYMDDCEERDWERNLLRLIKKSMRDGARRVWISDRQGRLQPGTAGEYDIFQPDQEKVMPDGMEESLRTSFPDAPSAGEIKWFYTEKVRENH